TSVFHLEFVFLVSLFCLGFAFVDSEDGTTLLEIKKSFKDVDNVLYDWTDTPSSDYCVWRGVTCDNVTFNVVALNLSGLNLDGEISTAIGMLKDLVTIDLRGNRLSGQIPDEIGDCSSLKTLDLSFNELDGDIPFSISKLRQLEFLVLKNNQLIGPIPSTLSQIPNLKVLDLSQNKLSGEIPRLIYWNEVLQYLGLRGNNLVGTLSPDMCQLTGLWYFDVRNNSLTGNIPQNIGNCTAFQVLDLSYNQLTGEIPFNIGFLQVATLSLQSNRLSGKIPSVIGLMQALAVLDLSCNKLSGPIPPILGNLTYTEKLELNDNHLTGLIPPELGKLTELFDLNVANNHLEGPIPENLSSCTNLNSLNVHGNKLNGTIPPAFERLESMTYLNLSSNDIKGFIAIELSRIGNLDTLDISNNKISGSIPSSLGDLEHLLKLNLSRNNLTGVIPAEFGNLRSVLEIDLSNNHLSGIIPRELAQLQDLYSLNVSHNNLAGDIPTSNNFSRFSPDSSNCHLIAVSLEIPGSVAIGFLLHATGLIPRREMLKLETEKALELENRYQNNELPPHSLFWHLRMEFLATTIPYCISISKAAILGIALGALVILLMILIAACRPHNPTPFPDGSLDKPVTYSRPKLVILHKNMALHVYEDIMRVTENLSEKYIIGSGASSTVYKCVLKNCRPVAIKRLYSHYPQCLKEFETELETIGSIKHRNLVSLQGYSLSPSRNLLFYDYMENGSLWHLLHVSTKRKVLSWDIRLKIALGAAQGLAYLHHDCSPRIIHRDVKSSNILLDKDLEAHLTDFGIAKSLCISKSHTSTYVMGTIGYIDPEYARTSRLTEKSDVYSYGIVLLELLTGRKPVDNESSLHHLILSKAANDAVMETIDPEITATCKDLGAVKKVFQLALLCTKRHPSDRPTMHEVTRVLVSLMPLEPPAKQPTTIPPAPLPSTKVTSYMDEYANLKTPHLVNCPSMSTSDAQLFINFGEVISRNSE
ncbi:hypothetical protein Goshw_020878, partial [Gossypium schwendimanii]|nr:hypothetical protein [Gossypium schwendimanii]